MRFKVHSPTGEPFEVMPRVAKKLVVYDGWTFDAPVTPDPDPVIFEAPVEAPEVSLEDDEDDRP